MSLNRLRASLYRRSPLCHWCKAETYFVQRKQPKALLATVDHVKSKPECSTHAEYIAKENKVLACNECNRQRNKAYIAAHPNARTPWKAKPTAMPRQYSLKHIDGCTVPAPATGHTYY